MVLKVITAIMAVRDILKYARELWDLAKRMRENDQIRKDEQATLEKLKNAKTANEVEDAARDSLGGF
jgi:hypothetical protein